MLVTFCKLLVICLCMQVDTVEQFLEVELHQRMPSFNMTEFQKQLMSVPYSIFLCPFLSLCH